MSEMWSDVDPFIFPIRHQDRLGRSSALPNYSADASTQICWPTASTHHCKIVKACSKVHISHNIDSE